MIVDSSAVLAILNREPDAEYYEMVIASASTLRLGDSIRLVPRKRGNTLLLEAPAVQMELARR